MSNDTDYEERIAWHVKRLRGERVPARRTPELDALEQARIRAYAEAKAVQHKALQKIQESRGTDASFVGLDGGEIVPRELGVRITKEQRAAYFAKSFEVLDTRDADEAIEFRDGPMGDA